jgi:hypothetical protein
MPFTLSERAKSCLCSAKMLVQCSLWELRILKAVVIFDESFWGRKRVPSHPIASWKHAQAT